MVVKDALGAYTMEFDNKRNIVREVHVGYQTKEVVERFQKDYETKMTPHLKGKRWAKCSDMRNYKTSDIQDKVAEHMGWAISNGLACAVMIVESTIVKRQMNNSVTPGQLLFQAFTDEKEADEWLKAQGF